MARGKIHIMKIENLYNRKNTYRKRRDGLLKKAYELSILSASEVVLMTRHPTNGNLSHFSYPKSGRLVIPNKDSLIDKLQNCKIQDDTAAAEETSIEQGNSGDDNQSIQHSEVINAQDFPQQILDYQRFYMMATPTTSEQLFDDYGEKLKVILSHIKERKMLLQQQEHAAAAVMQTDAFFANMQLQQQEEFSKHWQQGFILQQQGQNMQLQQPAHYMQLQPEAHNIQLQQQWQPQAHHNMQLQQQWQPQAHNMNNGHINPTGEQHFNQMELSTGLIPSAPLMPSRNNRAGPSHYFHQQSFEYDANSGPGHGQYNDELNFDYSHY